ncbi:hypothetical protein RQP46_000456 [Phenoliferia psychrophenolica]
MEDDSPPPSPWQPTSLAALLEEHEGDATLALQALIARHNSLIGQHATLGAEKEAAVKDSKRSALENQQLWRSLKSSGGSPRPPTAQRQNSGQDKPSNAGASADSSNGIAALLGAELVAPVPGRSQDDSFAHLSTPSRSRTTTTPPRTVSPLLSTSDSHSSLRKAVSLDLGRRPDIPLDDAAFEPAPNSPSAASAARSSLDDKSFSGTKLPTSASMPLIPSPEIPDRSSISSNSSSQNRRFLPSIIPHAPRDSSSSNAPATRPTLYAAFFPFTRVKVPSSNIKTKDKGKEIVSFLIDVAVTVPPESDPDGLGGKASWRIEKSFGEIVALDATVRGIKVNKAELKNLGPLPDKALFKDHAPHKSDQRKTTLERYLQTLLLVSLRDRSAVCTFFNSDIVLEPPAPPASSGAIEGWLTKRGRNFGGWQTRYYILASGSLSYYETREGQKLGEIPLQNAAIGRQSSRAADSGDDSYIHAFLVRTTTRAPNGDKDQEADHILCAESDEARDAWVTALTSLQAQPANVTRAGSASFDRERDRELSANGKAPHNASHLRNRERSGSAATSDPASAPASTPAGRRTLSADIPASVSLPAGLDSVARGEPGKRTTSAQGQNAELLSPDSRHKIVASQVSGPMNAAPMPSGYEFKKAERTKKTKSSFWNFSRNTAATDKPPGPALPTVAQRPVFGVPLKEAVAVSRIRPGLELPAVVYRCVEYLEAKNAESEEGIFRLSGSTNVIRVLKDRFNAEGDVQLLNSAEYYDPHAVAGLLKSFLRELPVHILTRELHPEFIAVIELKERKDRVNALGKLVARLPIEEYTLFRFFFAHLCVIAQNAEVSKMNLRNLGIVFSPTLAIPPPLFSLLLSEFDVRLPLLVRPWHVLTQDKQLVFAVEPTTGLSRPVMITLDDEPAAAEPRLGAPMTAERRNNRNSQMYEARSSPFSSSA